MRDSISLSGGQQLQSITRQAKAFIYRYDLFFLIVIIAAASMIRYSYAGHIVSGDDADNYLQVKRLLAGQPLTGIQLKHPPLYIWFNAAIAALFGLKAGTLILANIILSVIGIAGLYFIAKRWFGIGVAIAAVSFLALMPNNVFFSTWIKQDMLLALTILLTIYAWGNKRYLLSGVFLGAGMLVKESALIVVTILLVDIFFISRNKPARGFFIACITALVVCGWWYAIFVPAIRESSGGFAMNIFGLISGKGGFGKALSAPAWFYLRRVGLDISYAIVPLGLLGLLTRTAWDNQRTRLFTLWLVSGYLVSSITAAKAAWFISPFMIPAALIAAIGLKALASRVDDALVFMIAFVVLLFSGALLYGFSYNSYSRVSGYPTYYSYMFQTVGKAIDVRIQPGQRVAAPFKEALLLYFAPIEDDQIFLLPSKKSDVVEYIEKNRIDYVVIWYSETFFDVANVIDQQRQLSKVVPDEEWVDIWSNAFIVPTTAIRKVR